MYNLTSETRMADRHDRLPPDQPFGHMPTLRREGLAAGFEYYDAQADDARLTLGIVRTAVLDHGAVAANYAGITDLMKDDGGQVVGARIGDIDVRARVVVNATGVWSDEVRALDEARSRPACAPPRGSTP